MKIYIKLKKLSHCDTRNVILLHCTSIDAHTNSSAAPACKSVSADALAAAVVKVAVAAAAAAAAVVADADAADAAAEADECASAPPIECTAHAAPHTNDVSVASNTAMCSSPCCPYGCSECRCASEERASTASEARFRTY